VCRETVVIVAGLASARLAGPAGLRESNERYNHGIPMSALQLTQIGNSVGVILPKDVLARLKVEKGDLRYLSHSADAVMLTPYSPELEQQMDAARDIMKSRRNVLREWAK
jgi:putative addiction module antidote